MARVFLIPLSALLVCTLVTCANIPGVSASDSDNGCLVYDVFGVLHHDCRFARVETSFAPTILRLQQSMLKRLDSQDQIITSKTIGHWLVSLSLVKLRDPGTSLSNESGVDLARGNCIPHDQSEPTLVDGNNLSEVCKERLMCCDEEALGGNTVANFLPDLASCKTKCLLTLTIKDTRGGSVNDDHSLPARDRLLLEDIKNTGLEFESNAGLSDVNFCRFSSINLDNSVDNGDGKTVADCSGDDCRKEQHCKESFFSAGSPDEHAKDRQDLKLAGLKARRQRSHKSSPSTQSEKSPQFVDDDSDYDYDYPDGSDSASDPTTPSEPDSASPSPSTTPSKPDSASLPPASPHGASSSPSSPSSPDSASSTPSSPSSPDSSAAMQSSSSHSPNSSGAAAAAAAASSGGSAAAAAAAAASSA